MKATTVLLVALTSSAAWGASNATETTANSSITVTQTLPTAPPPTYMQVIAQRIRSEYKYPQKAQYDAEEGSVVVRVKIARDGTILSEELASRCKYDLLNAEALDVFKRVGRFPPVPDDIYPEVTTFEFTFPIDFRLN